MKIKQRVNKIVQQYHTRDPIKLSGLKGIHIQYRHLKGVLGYFQTYVRIPVIHVAIGLSDEMVVYVVAHELGHRILHPDVNVPFLRANTLQSVDKIEREANQFAVELLIPDSLLLEGMSIYEAAAVCGVPEEVASLKMPPQKGLCTEDLFFINS